MNSFTSEFCRMLLGSRIDVWESQLKNIFYLKGTNLILCKSSYIITVMETNFPGTLDLLCPWIT